MSALSIDSSSFLVALTSAFSAALLGGLHCFGMCGPLSALAQSRNEVAQFQVGRLLSYISIGALAGYFGGGVASLLPAELGLPAKIFLLLTALWILFSTDFDSFMKSALLRPLWSMRERVPWVPKFALLGLMNGIIPCGWLYAFLLFAVGTQSPLLGASILFGLWLGALPWLVLAPTVKEILPKGKKFQTGFRVGLVVLMAWMLFGGHSDHHAMHQESGADSKAGESAEHGHHH